MQETIPLPTTAIRPRSLLRRALASDLVDRLTAPHGVDRYLELIDPTWAVRSDGEASSPFAGGASLRSTTVVPEAPESLVSVDADVDPRQEASPNSDAASGAGVVVTFARSGLTAPADGTLLVVAEAAGLTPKNRCRRGICGTCTTPKVAGTTRNTITGETSSEPGPIRICVTEACDDQLVLDL